MQGRCFLALAAFCAVSESSLHALQRAPASCDQYLAAVQADPANLEAAASLGQCSVRDYEMIATGGDSTPMAFRSSWSVALRALRHAIELNPGYARAYRPLFFILFAETRDGCSSVTWECRHVSPVLRDGDTVLTIPRAVRPNAPFGFDTYEEVVRESQATRPANLAEARSRAEKWAKVAPTDRRPHEYLGQALLRMGDAAAATTELEYAATLGTPESRRALFWDRMEALIKTDRGEDARRVLDEAVSDAGRDTTRLRGLTVAGLNALLGRHRPPPRDTTSALARERTARRDSINRTLPPRGTAPPSFSALLAAGDTTGARRTLARMDSMMMPRDGAMMYPRGGFNLQSAEQHLALGDTAVAEARLAELEQLFKERRFQYSLMLMYFGPPVTARAWLLTGDIAAARGRRDEARRMYRRVIGLWGGGDAELQPVVAQAGARLESLTAR